MKLLPHQSPSFREITARCLLAIFSTFAAAVAADPATPAARHWDLKLADQPSGSFTESSLASADGQVTTKERMAMEINRLGSKVSITNATETVENRPGQMQSLVSTMSSSQASTRPRATRTGE